MTSRVLVLEGTGEFSDPWHDLTATSQALTSLLSEMHDVDVEVVPSARAAKWSRPFNGADLLVLNISAPPPDAAGFNESRQLREPLFRAIIDYAKAGGSVLAVHQSVLAAEWHPKLALLLGANWVTGESGHPEIGDMALALLTPERANRVYSDCPRIGDIVNIPGVSDYPGEAVRAFDERYCRLRYSPVIRALGWVWDDPEEPPITTSDGVTDQSADMYPALWLQQWPIDDPDFESSYQPGEAASLTRGNTIYSALGHDVRSYESPTHRALLRNAARWLLSQEARAHAS